MGGYPGFFVIQIIHFTSLHKKKKKKIHSILEEFLEIFRIKTVLTSCKWYFLHFNLFSIFAFWYLILKKPPNWAGGGSQKCNSSSFTLQSVLCLFNCSQESSILNEIQWQEAILAQALPLPSVWTTRIEAGAVLTDMATTLQNSSTYNDSCTYWWIYKSPWVRKPRQQTQARRRVFNYLDNSNNTSKQMQTTCKINEAADPKGASSCHDGEMAPTAGSVSSNQPYKFILSSCHHGKMSLRS